MCVCVYMRCAHKCRNLIIHNVWRIHRMSELLLLFCIFLARTATYIFRLVRLRSFSRSRAQRTNSLFVAHTNRFYGVYIVFAAMICDVWCRQSRKTEIILMSLIQNDGPIAIGWINCDSENKYLLSVVARIHTRTYDGLMGTRHCYKKFFSSVLIALMINE